MRNELLPNGSFGIYGATGGKWVRIWWCCPEHPHGDEASARACAYTVQTQRAEQRVERLHEAAPALLRSLKHLVQLVEYHQADLGHSLDRVLDQARKAIVSAEEESDES